MEWIASRTRPTPSILGLAAFLIAICFFVAFGLVGIGRTGMSFGWDMQYMFVAGEMWEMGLSPYEADQFKETMTSIVGQADGNYAYPPNSWLLAALLSLATLDIARGLTAAMDVAALVWFCRYVSLGADLSGGNAADGGRAATLLLAWAAIIGNPFAAHIAWMGQTTLIASALIVGAWFMAGRKRDILAGVLLALGAFKPQLAILIAFWFLMDRRWMLLASAAVTTLLLAAWPMWTAGIDGSWLAWIRGLGEYEDTIYNLVGAKHMFGLNSAFSNLGIELPSLAPVAILAMILLYLQRDRYEWPWLVAVIFVTTFIFVRAHDYDLAPATILAYPLLRDARRRPAVLLLVVTAAFLLFFPQRIWSGFGVPELARTRELALLILTGTYLVIGRRTRLVSA